MTKATPKIKATGILFDLEGTVIDTEYIWDEVDVEFLGRRGHTYNQATTKHHLMGKNLAGAIDKLKDLYGFEGHTSELADERRQIFGALLEREIDYIPGFLAAYRSLKPIYLTAIATSMERRFIAQADHKLGLTALFDTHIYSIEDIGFVAKPQPDIFLHAAAGLGLAPSQCLVIEDAPNSIEAAHRAGMACIALTTSTTRAHLQAADYIVDTYSDVLSLLK
jgi:beta-phosphoglucomutase-like phosphatase (HAD superfamily)